MMSIGFVSIEDASDVSTWSGIPFHILTALRGHGHRVELISPLSRNFKWLLAPQKLAANLSGTPTSLDHYPSALRNYARQISRAIKNKQFDVIFSTSSIPVTYLECAQPIVFWTDATFHGMIDYYGGQFGGLTHQAVERGMAQEQTAIDRADAVVYASSWAKKSACEFTDASKISVIHFGANLKNGLSEPDILIRGTQKRDQHQDTKTLLFCGVDWERKGGDTALEVVRIMNQKGMRTQLRVIGCHPPNEVPQYVKCLGYVDKRSSDGYKKLCEEFLRADMFLLPTRAEAAGIVFCEAAAFGLPSITFDTGGTSDYVSDGRTGFCLAQDSSPSKFATVCCDLLSDRELYSRMSLEAFRDYKTRLNWATAAERLTEIFQRLI